MKIAVIGIFLSGSALVCFSCYAHTYFLYELDYDDRKSNADPDHIVIETLITVGHGYHSEAAASDSSGHGGVAEYRYQRDDRADCQRGLCFWYQDLWSDQKLKGITIAPSEDGQSLISHAEGTANRLQWYIVSEDGSLAPVPGATEPVLESPENGLYCCAAEGQNISYSPYAAELPENYTLNGIASVVIQPSITMYSNVAAVEAVPSYDLNFPQLHEK